MTKVAILGGSGYTAAELLKILLRHPHAEVAAVTSRQEGTPPVAELHPSLNGRTRLRCEPFDPDRLLARGVECAFGCLPHAASMQALPRLLERGVRVIDLSADYRLRDPNVYAQWYGHAHEDLAHLAQAVYGLPELYRAYYAQAPFVRVVDHLPATKYCSGTNFLDVTVRVVRGRVVVLACEDNLVRGASGVAVQNFNRMYGLPETTALL